MPFQSVPNTAECVLLGASGGKTIVNVLHFLKPGGYSSADIQALATDVDGVCATAYPPLLSGDILYSGVRVKGLELINDFEFVASGGTAPGTATGQPLPANNSLCITFRSALTGRSARGRVYGWPASSGALSTTTDQYTPTYANALAAMFQAVQNAGSGAGWTQVIVSRFSNKVERPAGVTFPVTVIVSRNTTADSQRGRLPKGH